ncbi:large ribosomal subunit protein uL22-like [Miscanthus floridulus]|uniref:large ribosomal subunit protein uL22-like n=1 Tax=Miscanthus floridulus TaxID=154761 RepID=UPI00345749E2
MLPNELSDVENTRETTFALRKLSLTKAKRYLEDVIAHKQAIPFHRYCGGVGRTTQAKSRHSNGQGRWPVKSARFILDLLKNADCNAEVKGLDVDTLYVLHIQCSIFLFTRFLSQFIMQVQFFPHEFITGTMDLTNQLKEWDEMATKLKADFEDMKLKL